MKNSKLYIPIYIPSKSDNQPALSNWILSILSEIIGYIQSSLLTARALYKIARALYNFVCSLDPPSRYKPAPHNFCDRCKNLNASTNFEISNFHTFKHFEFRMFLLEEEFSKLLLDKFRNLKVPEENKK